jgi:hypothetical protein
VRGNKKKEETKGHERKKLKKLKKLLAKQVNKSE